MTPDVLFQYTGPLAMAGWLVLLASPLVPRAAQVISGYIIPGILSVAYTALILVYWFGAEGGFDSLENVMRLFDFPGAALAGWVHFLAFDLFIGAWEVRTARREGIPHWQVIPCLFLTFMFGPIGLILFLGLRALRGRTLIGQEA
ncbi:MAG: ABA4-like family protein [Pseudomonadota bacterium]